jgi:hypothetical protein
MMICGEEPQGDEGGAWQSPYTAEEEKTGLDDPGIVVVPSVVGGE